MDLDSCWVGQNLLIYWGGLAEIAEIGMIMSSLLATIVTEPEIFRKMIGKVEYNDK